MINLKIAELRKKSGLTQQELGDILAVSYKTISKWENGTVLPDINMLPTLSKIFNVSVDAILGLVPLEENNYRPSNSGKAEYWQNRVEYLKRTRETMWNKDYFAFLVREVWKITKPVEILDCGCGYGALGLMLMPLLPTGSRYIGVDFSEKMLQEAKRVYDTESYDAEFIYSDIRDLKPEKRYDIVIAQAVLRHVNDAEVFLLKMVEMAKPGGLVISMECNRELETDGLYIEGMNYFSLCEKNGLKKLWKKELEMQNRDYSVAMKIPHYMKEMGLKNIDCRMNDKVLFLEPEKAGYQQILSDRIRADHWDDEKSKAEMETNVTYFMNHGMTREEAVAYCNQQNGIVKYMKKHKNEVAMTRFSGHMISYGWK